MIIFFSWMIVVALVLYFLGSLTFFMSPEFMPAVIILSLVIGGASALVIIILLIRERLKDKEVEKFDLNKY